MLRAYTYKAAELGLPAIPPGTLRFATAVEVSRPDEADVFIVPVPLRTLGPADRVRRLPYLPGREERHVLFDVSDDVHVHNLRSIFIRSSLRRSMLAADPNSISWPWPAEDLAGVAGPPEGGWRWDVSFVGWKSSEVRTSSARSCLAEPGLSARIVMYGEFYGHVHRDRPAEAAERRRLFLEAMRGSKLSLAGRSAPGNFPYRFFEALSAARIPVLFCDDYVLPWEREIDWGKCALLYPESAAPEAGRLLGEFLAKTSEAELAERASYGRAAWRRYLDPGKWPDLMEEAVAKKMAEIGIGPAGGAP